LVELVLANGEVWHLAATSAAVSIEQSLYFADTAGACVAQQVVLRASCHGDSHVSWVIERAQLPGPESPRARSNREAGLIDRLAETSAGFDDLETE
jgi:hypothetical protein